MATREELEEQLRQFKALNSEEGFTGEYPETGPYMTGESLEDVPGAISKTEDLIGQLPEQARELGSTIGEKTAELGPQIPDKLAQFKNFLSERASKQGMLGGVLTGQGLAERAGNLAGKALDKVDTTVDESDMLNPEIDPGILTQEAPEQMLQTRESGDDKQSIERQLQAAKVAPVQPEEDPLTVAQRERDRRERLISLMQGLSTIGSGIASAYGKPIGKADFSQFYKSAGRGVEDILTQRKMELDAKKLARAEERESRLEKALALRGKEFGLREKGEERRGEQFEFKKEETDTGRKEKLTKDFNKDKTVESIKNNIRAADKAELIIQKGQKMAPAIMGRLLARMAGEVGVMTDQDVASFRGSAAWNDSLERWFQKGITGNLTDTDKSEMQNMVTRMREAERKALTGYADTYAQQFEKSTGLPREEISKMILPKAVEDIFGKEKIKVKTPDGKIWSIDKDKLEDAKKRGAEEIK